MLQVLGSKGQSLRSRLRPPCWKMHFLSLLTRCLENYRTEFHQNFSFDAFWDRDKRFNFRDQKVKGQGHSMTKGGIQISMLISSDTKIYR